MIEMEKLNDDFIAQEHADAWKKQEVKCGLWEMFVPVLAIQGSDHGLPGKTQKRRLGP